MWVLKCDQNTNDPSEEPPPFLLPRHQNDQQGPWDCTHTSEQRQGNMSLFYSSNFHKPELQVGASAQNTSYVPSCFLREIIRPRWSQSNWACQLEKWIKKSNYFESLPFDKSNFPRSIQLRRDKQSLSALSTLSLTPQSHSQTSRSNNRVWVFGSDAPVQRHAAITHTQPVETGQARAQRRRTFQFITAVIFGRWEGKVAPPPELGPPKKALLLALAWLTDAACWHYSCFNANKTYLMVEELDPACAQESRWREDVWLDVRGWGAPLGGLATTASSSEELSSDAPRMNLRRSLAPGPELSFGGRVRVEGLAAEGTGGVSASRVSSLRSADVLTIWGPGPSLCSEVEGTVDRECWPGGGDWAVDGSSLAEGGRPSDGVLSSFTGIINGLVLILQSEYNIHRINPNSAKWSIYGHSPEAATTQKNSFIKSDKNL